MATGPGLAARLVGLAAVTVLVAGCDHVYSIDETQRALAAAGVAPSGGRLGVADVELSCSHADRSTRVT